MPCFRGAPPSTPQKIMCALSQSGKRGPNQENEADSLISKDVIIVAVDLVFSLLVLVIVIIIVVIAFIVVSKASVVIIGLNSGYRCL